VDKRSKKLIEKSVALIEKEQYDQAVKILTPLVAENNLHAKSYMALLYQCGFGVPLDIQKAIDLYLEVAESHSKEDNISATAYNNLATLYSTGALGCQSDKIQSRDYWRKAKKLGFEMIPNEWLK